MPTTKTPMESDRFIGDAEVIAIRFDGGDLQIDIVNPGPTENKANLLTFSKVEFFQFCGQSVLILERIEAYDGVEQALEVPSIAQILKNRELLDEMSFGHLRFSDWPVYRLVPLAGSESFVICSTATIGEWRTV